MVRTFDFVFILQRNENLRKEIYELMDSSYDEETDIGGWHLLFNPKRRWVVVTDNGSDEFLKYKFTPAEIEYDSLIHLMDPAKHNEEYDFKMNYREDLL